MVWCLWWSWLVALGRLPAGNVAAACGAAGCVVRAAYPWGLERDAGQADDAHHPPAQPELGLGRQLAACLVSGDLRVAE